MSKVKTSLKNLQRCIVLRLKEHNVGNPFDWAPQLPSAGPTAVPMEGVTSSSLEIEHADLSHDEIISARDDRTVVAIAPPMPMQLVTPHAVNESTAGTVDGTTWGVTAVRAPRSQETGAGVVVAVLDTGIDADHVAFSGMNLIQKDFTGEGNGDRHGHGTHCAGTVFGRDVEGTRIGVARGVSTALIGKVIGSRGADSAQVVEAIQWATSQGANVISMSLGIDFPGYVKILENRGLQTEAAVSMALYGYRANVRLFEAIAALIRAQSLAGGAGSLLIAAAGNESRRDFNPPYEVVVAPPATAEGILSVGAVGVSQNSTRPFVVAPFSNTGPNIVGPGVDVLSAKRGGGLAVMSGTSMATPHVAGCAALWAERITKQGQQLTANLLINRLVGQAVELSGLDQLDIGSGLVVAPQPLGIT